MDVLGSETCLRSNELMGWLVDLDSETSDRPLDAASALGSCTISVGDIDNDFY